MTEVNQKTYISTYFIDIQIEIDILVTYEFKQFYMHDKHCAQKEVQIFDIR